MSDRFNKEKSVQLKGVGIIFMFWLHLYGHDSLIQNGNYYTEFFGGGTKLSVSYDTMVRRDTPHNSPS